MYHSDIYIDCNSFLELIYSDNAESFKDIFSDSRLIIEDTEMTQMILDDALKALNYQGEEGDEIPNKNINPILLEDFGVNLLYPDKIKLGGSVNFYNGLASPFSIFIKDIDKEEIDTLASQHGFKYFNLKSFKDYDMKARSIEMKIKKDSSILKIPIDFSKERILFVNSRYFLDNFAQKSLNKTENYPMRDCFSKYVETFFGNRNKDGFIEICFLSFELDKIITQTKVYKKYVIGKKKYNQKEEKFESIRYASDLMNLMSGKSSNSYERMNAHEKMTLQSHFYDLFAKEALEYIFNELKASLLSSGFDNFKITIIRLDPEYYFANHSRFILTNNLKLTIDRFEKGSKRRCDCPTIDGISSVEFNCLHNNFNNYIDEIKNSYCKYKESKIISHLWDSSVKVTSDYKFIEKCHQNGVVMKRGANEKSPNYIYQLLNSIS